MCRGRWGTTFRPPKHLNVEGVVEFDPPGSTLRRYLLFHHVFVDDTLTPGVVTHEAGRWGLGSGGVSDGRVWEERAEKEDVHDVGTLSQNLTKVTIPPPSDTHRSFPLRTQLVLPGASLLSNPRDPTQNRRGVDKRGTLNDYSLLPIPWDPR